MIINQNVCVTITSKNKEHFENKGFESEYHVDRDGITRLKHKKITVNVFDLQSQSKVKIDVKCDNCGNIFKKEFGFSIKNKNHYCCNECQSDKKSIKALKEFEEKTKEDAYTYLYREYVENKRTFRQISKDVYGTSKNSTSIGRWVKKLNIPIRYGSEAIKSQWINADERRKISSETMKNNQANGIDRSFMKTYEYRKKQSESKKGCKNGMWRVCGDKHPGWNPNRTSEMRKLQRKSTEDTIWRSTVFARDNRICCKCNQEKGSRMVVHHINSYDIHESQRYDLDNGVVMCEECHKAFHHKYGYGKNTIEQFEEYLKLD